jgi:putative ABC transport system ATP-binding protein
MSYIIAEQVTRTFGSEDSLVTAVDDISFEIAAGEFVAVMGESGAGKSTLLGTIGAMNAPTSGRLVVDEIDVYGLHQEKQADFRREFLGFIFQSFHLVPYLTVIENVMLPLAVIKLEKRKKQAMAIDALTQVGLADKAHRLPNQISGGESERVAVARAIVNEPPVLLADEPTGNLDTKTTQGIMELLARLNQDSMTIIMVTHSQECARYAHRIMQISDGCLISDKGNTKYSKHDIESEADAVFLIQTGCYEDKEVKG